MAKIQRLSQSQPRNCPDAHLYSLESYWSGFMASELGKIYQAIPWSKLVSTLGLVDNRLGRKSLLSPQGKLGLLFLKHYACCSDARLVEHLNSNVWYQLFCGILIDPGDGFKHRQLVSRIRCEVAELLSIEDFQRVLANYWQAYLPDSEHLLVDATCYESEIRYPTDPKLLWESMVWLYGLVVRIYKNLGLRKPRTKYKKWALRYQRYCRQRKPRVKTRKGIKGGLLRLLKKLITLLEEVNSDQSDLLSVKEKGRLVLIQQVYAQQLQLFTSGEKPAGRIISLAKPYLRPIVRGKENKPVEFGAKVNKLQLSGINFIEHLSFDAFHEGIRLEASIFTARKLVGKIRTASADQIYATNPNRTYCKKAHIFTDFKPKGRKGKWETQNKLLRHALTRERASRLEGSFGNEKNYYHLRKIKARTRKNEILWICLGIHTANALEIGRRMAKKAQEVAA